MIQPVILCGGSGTRLWPVSTPAKPKPFVDLMGEETLFRQTLRRVSDPDRFAAPLIVAGTAHTKLIEASAQKHSLIVEPSARNTAPAIALAALRLEPSTVMMVCPSDHHIADTPAFLTAVAEARNLASQGFLVSLGVVPDRAETGFGYIERGEPLAGGHKVKRFVEKPDAATAARFIAEGGFAWNAGIFLFTAGSFLEELAAFRPQMHAQVQDASANGLKEGARFYPEASAFAAIEGESIDYAVMENTGKAALVTADMGWSDIGSWSALAGSEDKGPVDRIACERVAVRSDGPRVSAVGLKDVSIIVEGDEVLVVSHDCAQDVARLPGARGVSRPSSPED